MRRLPRSWTLTALALGLVCLGPLAPHARAAECGNDADEDGFIDRDCETGVRSDCDDNDDSVYPGAPEVPYDGIDQDCDGRDSCDEDGDGYTAESCTELDGDGNPVPGTDCDDTNAEIHPFAEELADDGIDQDCSGSDLSLDCDLDEDGFDARACGGGDCDDLDPEIHPNALEIEDDGVDQDCDGQDACGDIAWVQGGLGCATGPGSPSADPAALALGAGLGVLLSLRALRSRRAPASR